MKMSPQELQTILKILPNLPEAQLRDLYVALEEHEIIEEREKAVDFFMPFVNKVWPTFIEGAHHKRMARAFERVANGTCKRLIIDRKSTRLNSSHVSESRMPSSA